MYSQIQSAWKKRCRELKRAGYTIAQISEKLRLSQATVGRYTRGLTDQREIRQKPIKTVFPTIPDPNVRNTGNADGDGISYISQGKTINSVSFYFLLSLGIVILILVLLDRFVFDGKIFAFVFGGSENQNQTKGTGEKLGCGSCGKGFMGRDVLGLEEF